MSATVIVPLFAIGSYITLFGTIIGLSKRYKDSHKINSISLKQINS
jgi:hypothetical protein